MRNIVAFILSKIFFEPFGKIAYTRELELRKQYIVNKSSTIDSDWDKLIDKYCHVDFKVEYISNNKITTEYIDFKIPNVEKNFIYVSEQAFNSGQYLMTFFKKPNGYVSFYMLSWDEILDPKYIKNPMYTQEPNGSYRIDYKRFIDTASSLSKEYYISWLSNPDPYYTENNTAANFIIDIYNEIYKEYSFKNNIDLNELQTLYRTIAKRYNNFIINKWFPLINEDINKIWSDLRI